MHDGAGAAGAAVVAVVAGVVAGVGAPVGAPGVHMLPTVGGGPPEQNSAQPCNACSARNMTSSHDDEAWGREWMSCQLCRCCRAKPGHFPHRWTLDCMSQGAWAAQRVADQRDLQHLVAAAPW